MMPEQRLRAGANLADCIDRLEAGDCCHRDLSASNVFVDQDDRIYLIDWDSLYHPKLAFQANTTTGTMGYIAPFTRAGSRDWDPSRSWCPYADRYALAILIAEILLTGPQSAPAQEDGTMFAQSQLKDPDNDLVKGHIGAAWRLDRVAGQLLWKALHAASFDACPSPARWRSVLRKALRTAQSAADGSSRRGNGRVRPCTSCGAENWVTDAWYDQLQDRGVAFLCRACRAARRMQRDQTYPAVACEHCQQPARIPRDKLDALRAKGSPVLCPTCLSAQLGKWKSEQAAWSNDHPETACSQCGVPFRSRSTKLDTLAAEGKPVLCRDCLKRMLENRRSRPVRTHMAYCLRFS